MAAPKPSMVWNSSEGTRRMVEGDILSDLLKSIQLWASSFERLAVVVSTRTSPVVGSCGVDGVSGSIGGVLVVAARHQHCAGGKYRS